MQERNRWVVLIAVMVGLLALACGPARTTTTGGAQPARLENIEGSSFKRVVLTEKAAERIGIQTAPVREQQIERKRTVGGEVVSLASSAVLLVRATPNDLSTVDRGQAAHVRPLVPRDAAPREATSFAATTGTMTARSVDPPPGAAPEGKTPALYYVIDGAGHGLAVGQRVLIELGLQGSGALRKVVPHSALLYDVRGNTWVYTQAGPLTFVRAGVKVDYVDGDLAVLSEGPAAGTAVVAVGATELYGTEFKFSK